MSDLSLVNTLAATLVGAATDQALADALDLLRQHGIDATVYRREDEVFRPIGGGDAIATLSDTGRALAAGDQAGAFLPLRNGDETIGALQLERMDELGRELCSALTGILALALAKSQQPAPAEAAAGAREAALLDAVLESVGDGVLVYGQDFFRANAAAQRILGISAGEMPPAEVFVPRTLDGRPLPPEDYPARRAHETGLPQPYRLRARLLDGTERVFDGSVSPILMPGGEDMGTVVLFRDVTDEYDREFLTQRFLEELFENLPTAISVIDAHTREVQSVNRAYLELIGLGLDEVVGTRPPYPWWETSFDETEEDWATSERPVRLEGLFRHHEGRLVPVEILRILITGAGGAPERTVSLVTDLSERRRFEQQLVQSGKLAAIGELAAGIAHEINNPLFAILGLVEFLLKETEPGTKPYERLTLIQETGLEIKEIVRALLDFARERSDEFRPVILNEAVSQAAELLRRTSAAKQIDLEERYCDEPLLVNGSPSQLKQILLNLVANARQAMPDGGTITVEVVRDESWALLRVSDTGPGIPPEALGRIFDPFFTTRRDLGGTGLGLSVSLGIAHMHGGELTVSTAAGEGASFTLRLPIVEEVAP